MGHVQAVAACWEWVKHRWHSLSSHLFLCLSVLHVDEILSSPAGHIDVQQKDRENHLHAERTTPPYSWVAAPFDEGVLLHADGELVPQTAGGGFLRGCFAFAHCYLRSARRKIQEVSPL